MATAENLHFGAEIPPPMDVFERKVVHEDNQLLLQQRIETFKPILKRKELGELRKKAGQLRGQLNKAGYNRLIEKEHDLAQQLENVKKHYADAKESFLALATEDLKRQQAEALELTEAETEEGIHNLMQLRRNKLNQVKSLQSQGLNLCAQGRVVQSKIDALRPLHDQYSEAVNRIKAHELASKEWKTTLREEKQYMKESKIIESLLKDVMRNTPGCHHVWYDKNDKRHCDIPKIRRAGFNGDSHWFLLEASKKTATGWQQLLPYGVVVENLISEKTIENMSVALNRQVEVHRSQAGTQVYYLVNRLDSPDGLPRKVLYRQMFDFYPKAKHHLLPWPAGVSSNRKVEWYTFGERPHVLIAGSSQSGKSNQVNCIIATLSSMNSPAECRLILIDNKGGVEFTHWGELPHLLMPMIKTVDGVLPALSKAIQIMHKRFAALEATKAKDIDRYNSRVEPESKWPRIVIFIDELATLLSSEHTRDIQQAMNILASMGRACGIHMVMCTQHPNVDALPGNVKTNLDIRMVGAMPSVTSSMIALDAPDAKNLPRIPGRMAIGIGAVIKEVQTAYITDQDIEMAVLRSKLFGAPPVIPELEANFAASIKLVKTFGVEEVIDLALNAFDGKLSAQAMHAYLTQEGYSPGEWKLKKLVAEIIEKEALEYEGVEYGIQKLRRAHYLKPINLNTPQPEETDIEDEALIAI